MKRDKPSIVPSMRYRDANAAIEWLCNACGFEKVLVVPTDDGGVAHAQLTLENGMIMLGSARDDEIGRVMKPPVEVDGINTQSAYVIVSDIDAHHARARKAGAEIVKELEEQEYGGKLYSCRDPEGHVWHFGSYDPWSDA